MAKLRLLTSVAVMAAMLGAALPATAFAHDDEVPVTCGVFLVATAAGQDEVDGNKVKNEGGAAMGGLACETPDGAGSFLSGPLTLSNIKSKVTLDGSRTFVDAPTGDPEKDLIFFGIVGGPFFFDTFSGKLKADIAVGSLTGKIKVRVSGKILVDPTGAPVLIGGNIIGFAEVYSDGNWKVEGDDVEAEGDFVGISLALTLVPGDPDMITLMGGGMISGELEVEYEGEEGKKGKKDNKDDD